LVVALAKEDAMQTVLYVSPMTLGNELDVRTIHENFPLETLEEASGVESLQAFIGSGFYALEITVGDGDFQEQFHRFLETPAVVDLLTALRPYVSDLPQPGEETADMPLAAPLIQWQRGARG
jgi:hypothetical protein